MNSKDLIKYGLIALGAYLIYEYIQKNGGLSGIFGSTAAAGGTNAGSWVNLLPLYQKILGSSLTAAQVQAMQNNQDPRLTQAQLNQLTAYQVSQQSLTNPAGGTGTGSSVATITPPVLDITGLTVVPDINDSLTGTVKINGVPTRLSIITASGAIYDATGSDVTATLQGEGIDVVGLRTAFANAAPAAAMTTTTAILSPCSQPNYFQGGICVDAFTGQPIPNTMSQSQQNGVAGLGAMRFTPPWLM